MNKYFQPKNINFNGHLCKDTKLDNMNTRILERNNNNETTILLNPRPVNSISLDNKPVSVKTSFETINTEKNYTINNHHSGGWNSYVKSIDNESDIFLSSRKNQNDCPYQLLNPNQEAQEKSKHNIDNIFYGNLIVDVGGDNCLPMSNIAKPLDKRMEGVEYCRNVLNDPNSDKNFPCTNAYRMRPVDKPTRSINSYKPEPFVIGPMYSKNQCENLWNNLTKSKTKSFKRYN